MSANRRGMSRAPDHMGDKVNTYSESLELEEWTKQLVETFRVKFNKVPENVDKKIFGLVNLSAPCQIVALWWKDPERFHFLVTHNPNIKDLLIVTLGPHSKNEMEIAIKNILKLEVLNAKLTEEDSSLYGNKSYSQVLEDEFVWWIRQADNMKERNLGEFTGEPSIGFKKVFCSGGFMWIAVGNIIKVSPSVIAERLISAEIKDWQERQHMPPLVVKKTPNEIYVKGYAGLFIPRIWFGSKPLPTFEEKVKGQVLAGIGHFENSYKNRILIFEEQSLVFIEGDDQIECLRLLNEIAGAFMLSGIGCYEFTLGRIGQSSFQHKKVGLNQFYVVPSKFMTLDERRFFGLGLGIDINVMRAYKEIREERIIPILKFAEKVIDSIQKSQHLTSLLHAYTEFSMANSKEAFLNSFLLVEALSKKNVIKKSTLDSLYAIRNKTVHPPYYVPSLNEAKDCFLVARDSVMRELRWKVLARGRNLEGVLLDEK